MQKNIQEKNMKKDNKKNRAVLFSALLWVSGLLLPISTFAEGLENPIGESDPNIIIARIITAFLSILSGLSLIIFIYGGFLMMFSGGNPEILGKAKRTISWAVIGLMIILGSYGITKYVFNVLVGA